MRERTLLSIALPLLLALLCPPASAARLEATLGFGGYAVPGRWNPLWIRCDGAAASAKLLVVRETAGGRAIGRESFGLPAGGRVECPVWAADGLESVSVRLASADGILAELRLSATSRIFPGHLVLACGLSARARLAIASVLLPSEPLQAVAVAEGDLPSNGLDYDGVSAAAIGDSGAGLSPAQREALLAWIAGGGRLVVFSARPGKDSLLGSLSLGESASSYGLGSIVRITRDLAAEGGVAAWRPLLALEPYGRAPRISASSVATGSRAGGNPDEAARKARLALLVAVAAWLAATAGAAVLGRGRRGSGALAIATVAAISLALVLAGRPALDRALMRGATARAVAIVLPESGSVLVSASVKGPVPSEAFAWTAIRARLPLAVAYAAGSEGGSAEWAHGLPRAAFSPLSTGGDDLALSAVLGRRAMAGSTMPAPPLIDSPYAMAFIEAGAANPWWIKMPGARWEKIAETPSWLQEEARWLLGLREGRPGLSFVVGKGDAPSLGLSVAGGPLQELCWTVPLAGALAGPLAEGGR